MKINLKLSPSAKFTSIDIDLTEIVNNESIWNELSFSEKCMKLQEYVDAENESNRPYWQIESFNLE